MSICAYLNKYIYIYIYIHTCICIYVEPPHSEVAAAQRRLHGAEPDRALRVPPRGTIVNTMCRYDWSNNDLCHSILPSLCFCCALPYNNLHGAEPDRALRVPPGCRYLDFWKFIDMFMILEFYNLGIFGILELYRHVLRSCSARASGL